MSGEQLLTSLLSVRSLFLPDTPCLFWRKLLTLLVITTLFSPLDICSRFSQVKLTSESCEYSAFSRPSSNFHCRLIPLGIGGVLSTCQRLMITVLLGNTLFTYLDDLIIFSKSISEHFQKLHFVFPSLNDSGLMLKLAVLIFWPVPSFSSLQLQNLFVSSTNIFSTHSFNTFKITCSSTEKYSLFTIPHMPNPSYVHYLLHNNICSILRIIVSETFSCVSNRNLR